jgi:hypothetical protein
MPDILAAWSHNFKQRNNDDHNEGKDYSGFPWHLLESIVKKRERDGHKLEQVVAYAEVFDWQGPISLGCTCCTRGQGAIR